MLRLEPVTPDSGSNSQHSKGVVDSSLPTELVASSTAFLTGGIHPTDLTSAEQFAHLEHVNKTSYALNSSYGDWSYDLESSAAAFSGQHPLMAPLTYPCSDPVNFVFFNALNASRDPIAFSRGTLLPPVPGAPALATRERPPGCKTIFVGGIPEASTEDDLREMFEKCGAVLTIRLNAKKRFCHIRFSDEESVNHAMFLSGYRVRLGEGADPTHIGRLHVDFAEARDDQYEWECQQRAIQRQIRHRQRLEDRTALSSSPPPTVHYSEHEAQSLAERLKGEEFFSSAASTLVGWLEKGDCNKKTSNHFYTMVQSVNSHVRRLIGERRQLEEELAVLRERVGAETENILTQLDLIGHVLDSACKQRAWDHFSKAQRKNIEVWRKQVEEMQTKHRVEIHHEKREAEMMDLSDNDNNADADEVEADRRDRNPKRQRRSDEQNETDANDHDEQQPSENPPPRHEGGGGDDEGSDVKRVKRDVGDVRWKEENDQLRIQIEAYKNEIELMRQQQADGSQMEQGKGKERTQAESTSESGASLCPTDAKLIALLSPFLFIHPLGVTSNSLCSYLEQFELQLASCQLEIRLRNYSQLFCFDKANGTWRLAYLH